MNIIQDRYFIKDPREQIKTIKYTHELETYIQEITVFGLTEENELVYCNELNQLDYKEILKSCACYVMVLSKFNIPFHQILSIKETTNQLELLGFKILKVGTIDDD